MSRTYHPRPPRRARARRRAAAPPAPPPAARPWIPAPGDYVVAPSTWLRGVVCVFLGPETERRYLEIVDDDGKPTGDYDTSETEDVETGRALVRMVGDDGRHPVDPTDLRPHHDDVCSCGQIGCGCA